MDLHKFKREIKQPTSKSKSFDCILHIEMSIRCYILIKLKSTMKCHNRLDLLTGMLSCVELIAFWPSS